MTTIAEYLRQQGLQAGSQEGIQIGEQKVKETTLMIARNMLKKGADLDFIKSTTGLTEEEMTNLMG